MAESVNHQILSLLKSKPRGLSIREISVEIKLNRNSVSKYLQVLLVSGFIEERKLGPAKVYYPSQKVPVGALLNIFNEYVVVINSENKITQVNDTFLKEMKLSREEILGNNYHDLINESFHEHKDEMIDGVDLALHGQEISKEFSVKPDENLYHYFVKFIPTVFFDGDHGVTIIAEDISKKTNAIEALRLSEARFRKLFEHSHELISITDENAIPLWTNHAWEQVFGKASKYDTNPFEKVHPDDVAICRSEWGRLVSRDKSSISIQYRYLNPENEYMEFDSNAFVIETVGDRTFCVIANPKTKSLDSAE